MINLDLLADFLLEAHWRTKRFHRAFNKIPIPAQAKAVETYKAVKDGLVKPKMMPDIGKGKRNTIFSVGFSANGVIYRSIAKKVPNGDYHWLWIGTHEEYNTVKNRIRE
jgi:hypothetical protein